MNIDHLISYALWFYEFFLFYARRLYEIMNHRQNHYNHPRVKHILMLESLTAWPSQGLYCPFDQKKGLYCL